MEIKRIDIGINLMNKQFKEDRLEIVQKALDNGTGLIITGTDLYSSEQAINFIKENNLKNVWCTVGVHPHNAKEVDDGYITSLSRLVRHNSDIVVAVGEIGLDYDRMFSPADMQKHTLKEMLEIASVSGKPAFLHERSAVDDFIKTTKNNRNICKNSVVHCFTGTKETVYRYLQIGFMIGLTGWICDNRRNKDVVEALKIIPLERILIETDAPYLTPLNVKEKLPRRNTPDNLHYVIEKIAEVKNLSPIEVESIVLRNTLRTFKIEGTKNDKTSTSIQ